MLLGVVTGAVVGAFIGGGIGNATACGGPNEVEMCGLSNPVLFAVFIGFLAGAVLGGVLGALIKSPTGRSRR